MPVYSRAKSVSASGATSITATFDETTAPSSTSSLVAVLHASTLPANVTSNSWGVSALGGSGNNGSLNYLAAYVIRGDGARNSVTFNFSQGVTNSKVDLYAFNGFVSLTPDVSEGSSVSGVTSRTISVSAPVSKTNVISIAAISLSGSSGGFGSFANGYDKLDSAYTIMTTGTRAFTASGVIPTTSISWPTSRNVRSAIWNIEGVSANATTTPPTTETPSTGSPSTGSAPKFALGSTVLKAYLGTTLLSGTTTTPNPDPDPDPEPEPEVPVETPVNANGLTQSIMPSYSKAWTLAPAPTITWQASDSLTGSLILPTDARLKYTGHASTGTSKTPRGIVAASTSGYWRPRYMANSSTAGTGTDPNFLAMYGVRIRTNSPIIEVKLQQRPDLSGKSNINSPIAIRVKVNGQWTSRRPTYVGPNQVGYDSIGVPDNVTSTTQFWLRLNFGSTAVRDIEFVTMTEFGGFRLSAGSTITVGTAPDPAYRAVVLGDSINGGEKNGTGNFGLSDNGTKGVKGTYTHISSLWAYAAQTLGYDNVINSGSGSTGFNISGDTVKYSAPNRVEQDVVAFNPHLVMIGTSFNDIRANQTAAEIQSIATNLILTIKASLPKTIVVILGNPTPPIIALLGGASAVDPHNAALKSAAQSAGAYYLDPKAGDLYSPTGVRLKDGANMITGNEGYISSDSTHPTQAGADFFGSGYIADMLKLVHPVGSGTTTPPVTTPPVTTPPVTTNPVPDPTPTPNPNTPFPVNPDQRYGPRVNSKSAHTLGRTESADKNFYPARDSAGKWTSAGAYDACIQALAWQEDNPTKDIDILLPPGEMVGYGAASGSKPWLQGHLSNWGTAMLGTWSNDPNRRDIRIRPVDGFGSVKFAQGTSSKPASYDAYGNLVGQASPSFKNTFGFALSEIDANDVATAIRDSQMTFEFIGNLANWNVYAADRVEIDMTAIYYNKQRVKKGDWSTWSGSAATSRIDAVLTDFYTLPIRNPAKDEDGSEWTSKTKPHSDSIQAFGSGRVNIKYKGSYGVSNQNTFFQHGSTMHVDIEDSMIIGDQDMVNAMYPEKRVWLDNEQYVFHVVQGTGTGDSTSRRSYIIGPMKHSLFQNTAADTATSFSVTPWGGWTTISRSDFPSIPEILKMAPVPDGYQLWRAR